MTLSVKICERIRTYTRELARRLNVIGLMNVQFAIQGDKIYFYLKSIRELLELFRLSVKQSVNLG